MSDLPRLFEQACAVCPEARPRYRSPIGLSLWVRWHEQRNEFCYGRDGDTCPFQISESEARAAIVAQGMAVIFAWPQHLELPGDSPRRQAMYLVEFDTGPLAERALRAIIAVAPSVPSPRPPALEI